MVCSGTSRLVRFGVCANGLNRFRTKTRGKRNSRFGLTLTLAVHKLSENGAFAELREDWNIDDLRDCRREVYFPIVGVERRFFGYPSATHAVVLVSVKADSVEFLDPLATDKPQTTNRENFEAAWHSAGREVLVLQSPLPD